MVKDYNKWLSSSSTEGADWFLIDSLIVESIKYQLSKTDHYLIYIDYYKGLHLG